MRGFARAPEVAMSSKPFNLSHYLLGVRFDNWIRLLAKVHFRIEPNRIPQAALTTLLSLVLFPFALVEAAVCAVPIAKTKLEKDPIFILGCWRSGTTYLQNLLSRDEQFGWADPVNTCMFSNSVLLGWLLRGGVGVGLKNARPMDNVQYELSLPMEETFAVASFTPYAIDHMTAFPAAYHWYTKPAFVEDLTPLQRREWRAAYRYMIKKLSWRKGGKQLMFKSPDNTCRFRDLIEMYPDSKFINIHRDPYTTIKSTVHMFTKQMELLRLSPLPELNDLEDEMEDVIIGVFERMYRDLFAYEDKFGENHFVNVSYEEFVKAPEEGLRRIYDALALDGFDEALPNFRAFIDSQKDYKKNNYEFPARLREKINRRLGFYFERYGYEMVTEATV